MATAASLDDLQARHLKSTASAGETTRQPLRPVDLPDRIPKGGMRQEIAVLLALHPHVAAQPEPFDSTQTDEAAQRSILARIRSELGIQPGTTRRLTVIGE